MCASLPIKCFDLLNRKDYIHVLLPHKRTMEFDRVQKMFLNAKIASFGRCDK